MLSKMMSAQPLSFRKPPWFAGMKDSAWSLNLFKRMSESTFRIPFRSAIGLRFPTGLRGLPAFCIGLSNPSPSAAKGKLPSIAVSYASLHRSHFLVHLHTSVTDKSELLPLERAIN